MIGAYRQQLKPGKTSRTRWATTWWETAGVICWETRKNTSGWRHGETKAQSCPKSPIQGSVRLRMHGILPGNVYRLGDDVPVSGQACRMAQGARKIAGPAFAGLTYSQLTCCNGSAMNRHGVRVASERNIRQLRNVYGETSDKVIQGLL